MNDFDYEVMQKKRIARGAQNKKHKTKKCTLPSDYLTKKQKEKLSGEVLTVKMDAPMSWDQFCGLPEDIQKEYLMGIMGKYGASDKMMGQMFGRTHESVRQKRMSLGVDGIGQNRKNKEEIAERDKVWQEFLGKEEAIVLDTVGEKKLPVGKEKVVHGIDLSKVVSTEINIEGIRSWDELMEIVKWYPFVGEADVRIQFRKDV